MTDNRLQEIRGMIAAAKEVCDACGNEARYGPAHKIQGSTRYWHHEDGALYPCEAGSIWHALNRPPEKSLPGE